MEDPNSPEVVAARANQEDPIVMYLVVRESLGMSAGKIAIQCSHAAQMLLLQYFKELAHSKFLESDPEWNFLAQEAGWVLLFKDWLNSSFRKVALQADEKEWAKLKELPGYITVVDAGLTEIAAGSETVLGFSPMRKSQRPKILKKLQAL